MSAMFGVMCDGPCAEIVPSPLSVSDARQRARAQGWVRKVNPDRGSTDVIDLCRDCSKQPSAHPAS